MKRKVFDGRLIGPIVLLLAMSGCNFPQSRPPVTASRSVTQAYQTVEARMTQAATIPVPATVLPSVTQSSRVPETVTPAKSTETYQAPTVTPTATAICDQAAPGHPIDVTIPDDTQMQPGQSFTKIWRLQNAGTCTWTRAYQVKLFSGEKMGAPKSVPLPNEVEPGQSVDISVDLVAPRKAGKYQGNWKLRNASGDWFGIGPNGNSPFWVRIIVVQPPTTTPTPPTSTPTATLTPAAQASGMVTLAISDTLDLDNGQINPTGGEDFVYKKNNEKRHLLMPQGRAEIGIYGESLPSMSECQSQTMGKNPVVIDELAKGTYLCYRTNLGLPGWALFSNLNSEDYSISLEFLTWSLP